MTEDNVTTQRPSIGLSLIPIVFLIVMMTINVMVFKDNATYGPNQFALIFSALLAGLLGVLKLKTPYKVIEDAAVSSISMSMPGQSHYKEET